MLLNLGRYTLVSLLLLVFVGCGTYRYTNTSYHSSSYAQNKSYRVKGNDKRINVKVKKNQIKKNKVKPKKVYKTNVGSNIGTKNIINSKAMHRATMRPYVVFGKKYYPTVAHIDDQFKGVASWYGPDFHAKKTSNGEIYNMYAMTAAHKTLPMNTIVKVDNLENGLSTIVRVNDRGPFVKSRIIDLSNAAAHKIEMVKKGTAKVRLTVLGFNGKIATTYEERQETSSIGNYYLQVGVFSKKKGANITKRKFEMILDNDKYNVKIADGRLDKKKIYRVWISGFRSEDEASDFKESNNLHGSMIIAQ